MKENECHVCILFLEHDKSSHGHQQEQDEADDWSDDNLDNV